MQMIGISIAEIRGFNRRLDFLETFYFLLLSLKSWQMLEDMFRAVHVAISVAGSKSALVS